MINIPLICPNCTRPLQESGLCLCGTNVLPWTKPETDGEWLVRTDVHIAQWSAIMADSVSCHACLSDFEPSCVFYRSYADNGPDGPPFLDFCASCTVEHGLAPNRYAVVAISRFYKVVSPSGVYIRCVDGTDWIHRDVTIAAEVAENCTRVYIGLH